MATNVNRLPTGNDSFINISSGNYASVDDPVGSPDDFLTFIQSSMASVLFARVFWLPSIEPPGEHHNKLCKGNFQNLSFSSRFSKFVHSYPENQR